MKIILRTQIYSDYHNFTLELVTLKYTQERVVFHFKFICLQRFVLAKIDENINQN